MTIINQGNLASARRLARVSQMPPRSWRHLLLSSALLLSACGSSNAAAKDPKATVPSARAYSIAGIELGMTADQAKSAALKAGYRLASETPGSDWALELKSATSGPGPHFGDPLKGIASQEFAKAGQMVTVGYLAMPQGNTAWSVSYSAGPAIVSFSGAVNEMTKRYGRSSFASATGRWAQWCSAAAKSPRDCLRQAFLSVSESPNGVSMHTENARLRDQQKRLLLEHGGKKPSF